MADQHRHTRIDEGVKRGPRTYQHSPPAITPHPDVGVWHVPAGVDPDEVIERYMSEQTTAQIAASYGCTRKALTRWIRQQRPEQWKVAQSLRALCLKEDSEDGIKGACDALSLARARELLRSAQFDLQAIDPDFRPKQEVTQTVSPTLNIAVVVNAPEPVTISATPAVQQLPSNESK